MWPWKSIEQRYEAVAGDEEETKATARCQSPRRDDRWRWRSVVLAAGAAIVLLAIGGASYIFTNEGNEATSQEGNNQSSSDDSTATDPLPGCPKRSEWRTLSGDEQQAYISAVLCLRTQPSTLAPGTNKTAYDDYPWIHSHVGYYTHNSAPFLPWHRYFLHIYETTLREQCGYDGSLTYWDWTLDSEALEDSPVFDPETGFGSDGKVGGEISIGRSGRCLVDGPFANITADYYDVKYNPHCLSRGFRDLEGNLGHIDGHEICPESIEEVLNISDYEHFVALMESKVHDTIPFGIGGDFETFTAPYDPLFFLHHTQLDRLWWLWQQRQPDKGIKSYSGHKERHSLQLAGLDDDIKMQGLAPPVKVREIMNVEDELLCYTY